MTHYHHLGIIEFNAYNLTSARRILYSGDGRFMLRNEKTAKPARIGITLEHLFLYIEDGFIIDYNTPVIERYDCI